MNAKQIANLGIAAFGITSVVSLIATLAISHLRDHPPVDRDQDGVVDGVDDPIVFADGKLYTLCSIMPPGKLCFSGGNSVDNGWDDCQLEAETENVNDKCWIVIELPPGEIRGNWYGVDAEGNTTWLDLTSQP